MKRAQLRSIYFYEFKLGHSEAEAAENIKKAFGKGTASQRTIERWYKNFRASKENLDDKPRTGRPAQLDDTELIAAVEEDPRQTLADLATRFDVSDVTVMNHMRKMGKVKKLDKWVPCHSSHKYKGQ